MPVAYKGVSKIEGYSRMYEGEYHIKINRKWVQKKCDKRNACHHRCAYDLRKTVKSLQKEGCEVDTTAGSMIFPPKTSRFKGVTANLSDNRWKYQIYYDGKSHPGPLFSTEVEANKALKKKVKKLLDEGVEIKNAKFYGMEKVKMWDAKFQDCDKIDKTIRYHGFVWFDWGRSFRCKLGERCFSHSDQDELAKILSAYKDENYIASILGTLIDTDKDKTKQIQVKVEKKDTSHHAKARPIKRKKQSKKRKQVKRRKLRNSKKVVKKGLVLSEKKKKASQKKSARKSKPVSRKPCDIIKEANKEKHAWTPSEKARVRELKEKHSRTYQYKGALTTKYDWDKIAQDSKLESMRCGKIAGSSLRKYHYKGWFDMGSDETKPKGNPKEALRVVEKTFGSVSEFGFHVHQKCIEAVKNGYTHGNKDDYVFQQLSNKLKVASADLKHIYDNA